MSQIKVSFRTIVRYKNLAMLIRAHCARVNIDKRPKDAAVMPLPKEDTTPPVTKMYLVLVVMIFNPLRFHKMLQHNKNIKLYLNSLQAAKPKDSATCKRIS